MAARPYPKSREPKLVTLKLAGNKRLVERLTSRFIEFLEEDYEIIRVSRLLSNSDGGAHQYIDLMEG